jgi:RimJ/RimL family protein N-acetyltransferase
MKNGGIIMFVIWGKEKIKHLTDTEKQQWFDVLNYKLEEDRDISLLDPDILEKQSSIKDDYFKYIENCHRDDNFYSYYIFKNNHKIISVCRINIYHHQYVLEGLQTHQNYFGLGYATKLLDAMIYVLNKNGIDVVHSNVRIWNEASHRLHLKLGFQKYDEDANNIHYKLNTKLYLKNHLNIGFDVFGEAYGVMYRNDLHHKKSIDYQLMKNMIRIDKKSINILYHIEPQPIDVLIKKHELYAFSTKFKKENDEKTLKEVIAFTTKIVNHFDIPFEKMIFGGSELEIIKRGTDWCSDISRVGCALLQCLGIPSRLVYIADKSKAYHGHMVCEAYINYKYILCDFTYGVYGDLDKKHSVYDLMMHKEEINVIYKPCMKVGMENYFTGLFSMAAISAYNITEHHQYLTTKPNKYYMKLMKSHQDGTWKMLEDK